MNLEELKLIIAEGEGLTVEFKEKYTSKIDKDIVALSNSKGGFILFGVSDDGNVVGEKITNQMKAELLSLARNCDPHITITRISQIDNVVVIEISEGDEKPYSCSSGYFRRLDAVTQKMSQKEVRTMFRQTTDIFFESLPCKDFTFEDISLSKIRTFLKETKASFRVKKDNLLSFLSSLSIYKDNSISNAGALMFAADINKFIPHSETILAAFKGVDKMYIYDRKDIRDDLFTQLNGAIEFLKRHLNIRSEIHEFDRHDIYEIPLDALREALVNAIIHRDYSIRGTSIYVNVFDDRVEITNPGGLPTGINKDNFGKESIRRNLILADLFHRMGKVERMGTGIEKMKNLMLDAKLDEPVFTSDSFFHTAFYRSPEYALKPVAEKSVQKSTQKGIQKSTQKILEVITHNNFVTRAELAQQIGLSESGVKKQLRKLQEEGVLKRIGPDKGGHWEVVDKD